MIHKKQEQACATTFLDWYNQHNSTCYHIHFAEHIFPNMGRSGARTWDYVAHRSDEDPVWIALEVKGLATARDSNRTGEWRKFCSRITEQVKGRANGTFVVSFPPPLAFRQSDKNLLSRVMADLIAQAASTAPSGSSTDLGPEIAKQCAFWPTVKSNLDEYDIWGEYRPHKLLMEWNSDQQFAVKLGDHWIGKGGFALAHQQALNEVLGPGEITANTQLGQAKLKGAQKTMLLLDCPFCDFTLIEQHVGNMNPSFLSNIDYIYLVGNRQIVNVPLNRG